MVGIFVHTNYLERVSSRKWREHRNSSSCELPCQQKAMSWPQNFPPSCTGTVIQCDKSFSLGSSCVLRQSNKQKKMTWNSKGTSAHWLPLSVCFVPSVLPAARLKWKGAWLVHRKWVMFPVFLPVLLPKSLSHNFQTQGNKIAQTNRTVCWQELLNKWKQEIFTGNDDYQNVFGIAHVFLNATFGFAHNGVALKTCRNMKKHLNAARTASGLY